MRRRRSRCSPPPSPADVTVLSIFADDRRAPVPAAVSEADWAALRRHVAEALILQDAAEELLIAVRDRADPSDVAPPCGRITGRLVELRDAMAPRGDPEMDRYTGALRQILDHHILLIKTSLGFLAGAARSARLAERLDDIDGLGAPAHRLEAIRAEIIGRTAGA
jgi:hypothetical protein